MKDENKLLIKALIYGIIVVGLIALISGILNGTFIK